MVTRKKEEARYVKAPKRSGKGAISLSEPYPGRFQIYWITLDPTIGHEIQKTRPGVIVSPDEMNQALKTVIIAPLTSALRQLPFRPTVNVDDKTGQVALDQLRAVDKTRLVKYMDTLDTAEQNDMLRILNEMFR